MKFKVLVETESGNILNAADDGFVMWGNLYKGDGEGGLLGNCVDGGRLEASGIQKTAYTNFEFLDSLQLDVRVFEAYVTSKKSIQRR